MSLLQSSKIEGATSVEDNVAVTTQATSDNGYSSLVFWEVWNFMSIAHAKVEFDETNIINFKGYNDSGKSAMLRALDVLMFNYKPSHQTDFIKDGETYFRVLAGFSDGVAILRDKYANGQSLYEMYKDGKCIFSTKQGDLLTKVKEVPAPVAKYLGLIESDGTLLNSRSCFDKQLLVQTSGSDNYRFLNSVLKSEEIAVANELINVDKNKMSSDITSLEAELGIYKKQVELSRGINNSMITAMLKYDSDIDSIDNRVAEVSDCRSILDEYCAVPNIPELPNISADKLNAVAGIQKAFTELSSVNIAPELPTISADKLFSLKSCCSVASELENIQISPEVVEVDISRLNELVDLYHAYKAADDADAELRRISEEIDELNKAGELLAEQLNAAGRPQVRCKNCGALMDIGSCEHVH